MEIAKKNYRSDFDFILHLYSCLVDAEGKEAEGSRRELGWPDYDWTAKFWAANKANTYTASCVGGVCVNCREDNGMIRIVVNDHHMGPGQLKVEFRAELPDGLYPDGYQRNVVPEPLCIELVTGRGDLPTEIEAELLLPYIKGDKGDKLTYSDLTEEDKEDLIAPFSQEIKETLKSYPTNDEFNNALKEKQDTLDTSVDLRVTDGNRLSLTDSAKQRLFCDLFNAAAGPFGFGNPIGYARITDGAFDCELNGLPLTYEEAVLVYNVTNGAPAVGQCAGTAIKTNLWTVQPTYGSGASMDLLPPGIFVNCSKAEVLRIHKGSDNIAWAGDWRNMFTGCGSLREIIGIIGDYAAHGSISPFTRCAKLEKVKIHRLNGDIVLADSPLIDLESFTYIVTNRGAGTNTITITVHPDVYAKLTAHLRPEEEGYEDRDTDWDGLLDLAATHKITFASA